ncbi:MAG: zinc-ribbon and DUF3426 domain-containing protein [Gammaproteobacteria bacterium]|nr:zinc-ribbon and DUF3426 domain-containing protein [Gammaproteobacteria bacterium]
MQTECPHCHSIFEMNLEQLNQAHGQVRCGFCLAIFEASPIQADPEIQASVSSSHVITGDIDLFNNNNIKDELPRVLPDVIPPELRAESRAGKPRFGYLETTLLSIGIVASILAGIIQYSYYHRYQLVQKNELRPWLIKLCDITGCDLPEPRDPKRIELSSKNIFSHPNTANALMISATIVNQAEFEQTFPLLDLHFEDIRGKSIASRRFKPEEYLGISSDQISKMEPGNPVPFNIEIIDPGQEVVSYEFDFL